MDCAENDTNQVRINPKFEPMPGEFVYKNSYWCAWASEDIIRKIENDFEFFPDDIIVTSYSRSGTTVLQQLVWLICNDVDAETASTKSLMHRFPFLDDSFAFHNPENNFYGRIVDMAPKFKRPRFFKTHLQYENLENQIEKNPNMKVLVPLRNPKDNAVSMFHLYHGHKYYSPYKGTWDEFFEQWIDGWICGGDWLYFVTDWWKARVKKNVKIVFYEDIVFKRKDVIKEICEFLNKKLTDEQIDEVFHLTEFKSMKSNPATNVSLLKEASTFVNENFEYIRKGEVGDWKNYFTEEQNKRFDIKYKDALNNLGLNFRYE